MKILNVFIVLISLSLVSVSEMYSQSTEKDELKCLKSLRKGTFKYVEENEEYMIVRTRKRQIEMSLDGKSQLILKIKWLDERTYVLTFVKEINMTGCLRRHDTITTKIESCSGDTYKFSYLSNSCGHGASAIERIK